MTTLVTGGTGFLGAHTVVAALGAGHAVRVLARDPEAVGRAFVALGIDPASIEFLAGDVTDEAIMARAVSDVRFVVHAASVYSFDSRRRAEVRRTNRRGTEVTLAAARRAGVERTIHVSTFGALLPAASRMVGPDSPPGTATETYLASKSASERIAREHQAQGAPVMISYPPALLGPHDPRMGDQSTRLRAMLRGQMPVWPGGGFPVGDVRDTARLHVAMLSAPEDSGRFLSPGRYLSTRQYVQAVREATGRPFPTLFLPARMMLPAAAVTDLVQRIWPWHIPAEYGACYICACDSRPEPRPAAYGIDPTPLAETFTEAIRWLHHAGHVTAGQAGRSARDC
jgi:nucleoside-diphosphate-sugar epimerase